MGLAEKRMLAGYQADKYPGWQKQLNSLCGVDLAWEVAWDQIVKDGFTDAYPNTIDYNFFRPLENCLKQICADKIGKDAFTSKIKKVKISSTRPWSSLEVKIDGDTLILDADPTYQRDDTAIDDYTKRVMTVLEQVL